jgi:tRNA(fMet)-specific endonuclease VapC
MGYLIDTSVFVAWERGQLDRTNITDALGDHSVALSAITASELLHGVERAEGSLRRARRAAFVESIFEEIEVLPFDLDISRVHARVWADLLARGQSIGAHDTLIAATALHHGLTIATRNARDFARVDGLRFENW